MAAVLSRNLSNIIEITKIMDECKAMNINVLGPDVNESFLKFGVNKAGDVRFGLAAVKGVGESAVLNIIEERRKNGAFKSIFDFVERVNLTACNRKCMEGLALSGGFDNLSGITREQFFADNAKGEQFIEQLIQYGNKFQIDKQQNSNSLFGGDAVVEIAQPKIPAAEKWSDLERLNKERELIGIYLSAHPLDDYTTILKYVCNTNVSELEDKDALKNKAVVFGGIVTKVREGRTKTGNMYMIITVEDFDGSGEIALFGDDYINFSRYGKQGMFLYVKGNVQPRKFKQEEFELKINSIQLLQDVKDKLIEKISISLPLHGLNIAMIDELSGLIKGKAGRTTLYFDVQDGENNIKVELFARNMKINVDKELINYLTESEELSFKINN
jgi:DNA polymerase-3 subunit alpha